MRRLESPTYFATGANIQLTNKLTDKIDDLLGHLSMRINEKGEKPKLEF
jgi:hypothetical protein